MRPAVRVALLVALASAGVGVWFGMHEHATITAWLNSLTPTQRTVLRSLVLFAPIVVAIFAAASQRRRRPPEG
jgi:TRAP-type C4-dicarboxylate transport system permease small subunit